MWKPEVKKPPTKEEVIKELLEQSTYLPESGVYKELVQRLTPFPTYVLENLLLFQKIKIRDKISDAEDYFECDREHKD